MKKIFMLAFLCLQAIAMSANLTEECETLDDKVYDVVDVLPSYPGGEIAMMGYVAKNIVYPANAAENGIMGRVIIKFVVNEDGSISDVKAHELADFKATDNMSIEKVINNAFAEKTDKATSDSQKERLNVEKEGYLAIIKEAKRVVSAMPKWTPGKIKGADGKMSVVKTRFHIPLTFRLN